MTQQTTWAALPGGPGAGPPAGSVPVPPGPPQYGYQPPGAGAPPGYPHLMRRPTNAMAIVALVLGLTVAPGGLICGIIARKQIRETGEEGDGLALAGLIIGAVVTGMLFLALLLPLLSYLLVVLAFLGFG